MPTIVEGLASNAELLLGAVGPGARLVGNLEELKRELNQHDDEYAIVIGPSVDIDAAAALADTLRVTRPALSVVLVRRRVDTSVLAEALRSGMREVVEERDLTGLGSAVRRAREVWEALNGPVGISGSERRGRQVTVFSPKGGVGKTTVAVNLAIALADRGARKVALVDLDLAFGDVAITLQLFPKRSIADAVPMESGLDIDSLQSLMTVHRSHVSTLVAPVQPDAKDTIRASLIRKILGLLKSNYDFVVVDTSPAFDEQVLAAFDESDEVLLITSLDVPTLKNVKIAAETLDLLNFPAEKRQLILNRADDKVGLSPAKVESTLAMRISRSIPSSPQVANSTNSGEPIVAALPRHPVSQVFAAMASELTGAKPADRASRAATSKHAHPAPRRRGFLRRSGS